MMNAMLIAAALWGAPFFADRNAGSGGWCLVTCDELRWQCTGTVAAPSGGCWSVTASQGGPVLLTTCPPADPERPVRTGISRDGYWTLRAPRIVLKPGAPLAGGGATLAFAPAEEGGGPWLGIQFGPLPAALRSQLDVDEGLLILNVAKDSPADHAGLQQYDVLLKMKGKDVGAEAADLVEQVGQLASGEVVSLELIRGGRRITVDVTVGERPDDVGGLEYKFEDPPEAEVSRVQTVDPYRFFTFKDGALVEPDRDTVRKFEQLLPQLRGKAWTDKSVTRGAGTVVLLKKTDDGKSIEIRHEQPGKIEVRRTDEKGKTSEQTYADEQELSKGDPEAYELYKNSVKSRHGALFLGPRGGVSAWIGSEELEEALREFEKLKNEAGLAGSEALRKAHKHLEELLKHGVARSARAASTSIEREADGSIRVTTRKGDSELVETFRDEKHLKSERPDLFKRYAQLRQSEAADDSDN